MLGAGKYDDLATLVREKTDAKAVVIIVGGGDKGDGFVVQGDIFWTMSLPKVLRSIANEIDKDMAAETVSGGDIPKT